MVYLLKNVFLEECRLKGFIFDYNVLAYGLHCEDFLRIILLHEEHLAKAASPNYFHYFKSENGHIHVTLLRIDRFCSNFRTLFSW